MLLVGLSELRRRLEMAVHVSLSRRIVLRCTSECPGRGGCGAIDFAMHVDGCAFHGALDVQEWIAPDYAGPASRLPLAASAAISGHTELFRSGPDQFLPPYRLIDADLCVNVVVVTLSIEATPTGAEAHGTRSGRPFKGMAPVFRKAQGGLCCRTRHPCCWWNV